MGMPASPSDGSAPSRRPRTRRGTPPVTPLQDVLTTVAPVATQLSSDSPKKT
jgi:hypothetical protein